MDPHNGWRESFMLHLQDEHSLNEGLLDYIDARDELADFARRYEVRCTQHGIEWAPVPHSELVAFVMDEPVQQPEDHATWLRGVLMSAAEAVVHFDPRLRCAGIVGRLAAEAGMTLAERERFHTRLDRRSAA